MGQKTKQKSMLSVSPFPPLPAMKNWQSYTPRNKNSQHKQTISKTTANDGQVDRVYLISLSYLENCITQ